MKVKELKAALENTPDDLDVIIDATTIGSEPMLCPDGFHPLSACVVSASGLWNTGFWIKIGKGFRW